MNHDKGSYQLNHAYDCFPGTSSSSSRRAKNRKTSTSFLFRWRSL